MHLFVCWLPVISSSALWVHCPGCLCIASSCQEGCELLPGCLGYHVVVTAGLERTKIQGTRSGLGGGLGGELG
jgi:hypothetical protein